MYIILSALLAAAGLVLLFLPVLLRKRKESPPAASGPSRGFRLLTRLVGIVLLLTGAFLLVGLVSGWIVLPLR